MKLISIAASMVLLSAVSMAETPSAKEQGIAAIKQLGSTLKGELKSKIKEDPTAVAAAGFCAHSAETITEDINKKLPENVNVRRTSLKPRSSKNKPDATDIEVMDAFAKEAAAKQLGPKSMKIIETDKSTRVYKPLLTQKVCLKCHGSNLSPEISKIIKEKYPDDQAVGFKEGDLRGVIVAEVKKK